MKTRNDTAKAARAAMVFKILCRVHSWNKEWEEVWSDIARYIEAEKPRNNLLSPQQWARITGHCQIVGKSAWLEFTARQTDLLSLAGEAH